MNRSPLFRHLALALFALAIVAGTARSEDKAGAKIRVVLIDGWNNHAWNLTTPHLVKALESTGRFVVSVSTTPTTDGKDKNPSPSLRRVAFPPDLSQFDVFVSNYNNYIKGPGWPVELQRSLESALKNGKIGLVIVHSANNAFIGAWPEYDRMIGMGWRDNKYGERLKIGADGKEVREPKGTGLGAGHGPRKPFVVALRDTEHPITRGMPKEWMHAKDELYAGMRGPIQNVHLLATAFDDKATGGKGEIEPILWTVQYGKGRVFHTVLGHDMEAMSCWGFIGSLQRGTEWAATGKVTLPLPKQFPNADQISVTTGDLK